MGDFPTVDGAQSGERSRARRSSGPLTLIVGLAVLLLVAAAAWAAASPYMFPDQIKKAAQAGDREQLEELVDFPRVREGLKSDLRAMVADQVRVRGASDEYEGDDTMEMLASSLMGVFADALVNQLATPATLESLATDKPAEVRVMGRPSDPVDTAFPKSADGRRFRVEPRYLAFDRFRYTLINDARKSRVDIDLRRQGLFGWRAVRVTPKVEMEDLQGDQPAPIAEAASPPAAAATEQVVKLSGEVDGANADQALAKVADHVDEIIGLRALVSPPAENDGDYMADDSDGRLVISTATYEVLAPKGSYRWEHGAYVIDGFFLVKGGGVHQGVMSYGLEPVSEAAVRLKPNLTIVENGF